MQSLQKLKHAGLAKAEGNGAHIEGCQDAEEKSCLSSKQIVCVFFGKWQAGWLGVAGGAGLNGCCHWVPYQQRSADAMTIH